MTREEEPCSSTLIRQMHCQHHSAQGVRPLSLVDVKTPETGATAVCLRRTKRGRADYLSQALRGGYPEAVRRTAPRRRTRFFESYLADLTAHDLRQVTHIQRPNELRRLLGVLAATTAGLSVPHRISSDVGLPMTTLRRYLDTLELVYMIRRVPAWSSNLTTRAVGTPKLLFTDSGVAGHLARMTVAHGAHPLANIGPILESFALGREGSAIRPGPA